MSYQPNPPPMLSNGMQQGYPAAPQAQIPQQHHQGQALSNHQQQQQQYEQYQQQLFEQCKNVNNYIQNSQHRPQNGPHAPNMHSQYQTMMAPQQALQQNQMHSQQQTQPQPQHFQTQYVLQPMPSMQSMPCMPQVQIQQMQHIQPQMPQIAQIQMTPMPQSTISILQSQQHAQLTQQTLTNLMQWLIQLQYRSDLWASLPSEQRQAYCYWFNYLQGQIANNPVVRMQFIQMQDQVAKQAHMSQNFNNGNNINRPPLAGRNYNHNAYSGAKYNSQDNSFKHLNPHATNIPNNASGSSINTISQSPYMFSSNSLSNLSNTMTPCTNNSSNFTHPSQFQSYPNNMELPASNANVPNATTGNNLDPNQCQPERDESSDDFMHAFASSPNDNECDPYNTLNQSQTNQFAPVYNENMNPNMPCHQVSGNNFNNCMNRFSRNVSNSRKRNACEASINDSNVGGNQRKRRRMTKQTGNTTSTAITVESTVAPKIHQNSFINTNITYDSDQGSDLDTRLSNVCNQGVPKIGWKIYDILLKLVEKQCVQQYGINGTKSARSKQCESNQTKSNTSRTEDRTNISDDANNCNHSKRSLKVVPPYDTNFFAFLRLSKHLWKKQVKLQECLFNDPNYFITKFLHFANIRELRKINQLHRIATQNNISHVHHGDSVPTTIANTPHVPHMTHNSNYSLGASNFNNTNNVNVSNIGTRADDEAFFDSVLSELNLDKYEKSLRQHFDRQIGALRTHLVVTGLEQDGKESKNSKDMNPNACDCDLKVSNYPEPSLPKKKKGRRGRKKGFATGQNNRAMHNTNTSRPYNTRARKKSVKASNTSKKSKNKSKHKRFGKKTERKSDAEESSVKSTKRKDRGNVKSKIKIRDIPSKQIKRGKKLKKRGKLGKLGLGKTVKLAKTKKEVNSKENPICLTTDSNTISVESSNNTQLTGVMSMTSRCSTNNTESSSVVCLDPDTHSKASSIDIFGDEDLPVMPEMPKDDLSSIRKSSFFTTPPGSPEKARENCTRRSGEESARHSDGDDCAPSSELPLPNLFSPESSSRSQQPINCSDSGDLNDEYEQQLQDNGEIPPKIEGMPDMLADLDLEALLKRDKITLTLDGKSYTIDNAAIVDQMAELERRDFELIHKSVKTKIKEKLKRKLLTDNAINTCNESRKSFFSKSECNHENNAPESAVDANANENCGINIDVEDVPVEMMGSSWNQKDSSDAVVGPDAENGCNFSEGNEVFDADEILAEIADDQSQQDKTTDIKKDPVVQEKPSKVLHKPLRRSERLRQKHGYN